MRIGIRQRNFQLGEVVLFLFVVCNVPDLSIGEREGGSGIINPKGIVLG
jgi:hypothetical protein